MRENGTDRDVALLLLQAVDSAATLVTTINDNLYVPHIITQPTDCVVAVGETVTFTVVANNVAAYQWQYKTTGNWRDMEAPIVGNEATLTFVKESATYTNSYRCVITGKDGSVIYTDIVKPVPPES